MSATLTGSRRVDAGIFALLACWVVASSPLLRVYFRLTVTDVRAFAVLPDGERRELQMPAATSMRSFGTQRPAEEEVAWVEARIRERTPHSRVWNRLPPGSQIEFRVRYGERPDVLDREHVFRVEPDVPGR